MNIMSNGPSVYSAGNQHLGEQEIAVCRPMKCVTLELGDLKSNICQKNYGNE